MKKLAIFFCLLFFGGFNLFALTVDKDWMHTTTTVTKQVKGSWGKTSTVKEEKKTNTGVEAVGVGLSAGYPSLGLAVRYRGSDNHFKIMTNLNYNYGNSLAAQLVNLNYFSPAVDIDGCIEYGFSINISPKKAKKKYWNLDILPTIGLGFHIPLDDPKNPVDYYALCGNIGLTAACDLPYSSLPMTVYLRGLYKPTIPFIASHNIEIINTFSIEAGFTLNFIELKRPKSNNKTKTTVKTTTTTKSTAKPATNTKNTKASATKSKATKPATNTKNTKTTTKKK